MSVGHRDTETQRHRDTETQRHGDTETRRHGDTEANSTPDAPWFSDANSLFSLRIGKSRLGRSAAVEARHCVSVADFPFRARPTFDHRSRYNARQCRSLRLTTHLLHSPSSPANSPA